METGNFKRIDNSPKKYIREKRNKEKKMDILQSYEDIGPYTLGTVEIHESHITSIHIENLIEKEVMRRESGKRERKIYLNRFKEILEKEELQEEPEILKYSKEKRIQKAKNLMKELKPKEIDIRPGEVTKLDDNIILERTKKGYRLMLVE